MRDDGRRRPALLPALLCLVLSTLAVAGRAHAQSVTGAVQGRVRDAATGAPLPGVTVVATSPALQGSQAEVTDDDGVVLIQHLPPGRYELVFYYGAVQVRQADVVVMVGSTTPVHLKIAADAAGGEVIEITQRAPMIDAGSGKQGAKLDRAFLTHVPQQGRSFDGALGAAAGAQDDAYGTSFSGSTSVENSYVIDGLNTTGLAYGTVGSPLLTAFVEELEIITGGYDAEHGRATGGVVNVVTKSGGNTLRGSAWLSGTAGALSRPAASPVVAGSALSEDARLRYQGDLGVELGGPLVRDTLWFYVGVAPVLESTRVTRKVSIQVDRRHDGHDYAADPDADDDPTTTTAVGCELSGACESDGIPDVDPATGFARTEEVDREASTTYRRSVQFAGKLSFAASADHQGSLGVSGAAGGALEAGGVEGTPTALELDRRELVTDTSLRWTSKLGDGATEVSLVLGWHRADSRVAPAHATLADDPTRATGDTPSIEVTSTDLGTVGRNPDRRESATTLRWCTDDDPMLADPFPTITNCPVPSYRYNSPGLLEDRLEQRYAGKLAVTRRFRLAGRHQAKLGLDGEDNRLADVRRFTGGRQQVGQGEGWEILRYVELDAAGDDACGLDPETGEMRPCRYLAELPVDGETLSWAAYLQDRWDLRPNLRLSAGVRYERQVLRYAEQVRGTVDPLTGFARGDDAIDLGSLWAPRVGLTWDWTDEGRSKVYASYGRFYEAIPMDINTRAFGGETDYLVAYDWHQQCGAAPTPQGGGPSLPSDPANCPAKPTVAAPPMWDALFGASNTLVAPGLDAQRLDELALGVEYELAPDWTVGLAYQHRSLGRVIEDVSVDGTETYIVANPGELDEDAEAELEAEIAALPDGPERDALAERLADFRKIRDFDRPRRAYDAVTLSVRRRFTGGLFAQAAYTYSRLAGNYPGLYSDNNGQLDPNITSQWDLVELLANREGRLPADRPHLVKLAGFYQLDLAATGTVTAGVNLSAHSGKPVETLGSHTLYGAHEVFVLPRGRAGRTDFVVQADLRLGFSRDLGGGRTLAVSLDFLNVLDTATPTAVDQVYTLDNVDPIVGGSAADLPHLKRQDEAGVETGELARKQPNYRRATAVQDPLTARIGVSLSF